MAHVPPTNSALANSAAAPLDHGEFSASSSVPEARRRLGITQGLASTSPTGTSPSLNIIHNTSNYFVKNAKNVSMGPNHGTINQNSASGELEEESYLAALDFLSKHMAAGAIHDSKERCDAPKCMPETRVAVQDEILSWITDGQKDAEPKRILWVTGPAGTGKTAILGTIAERCKAKKMLGATFFFSSFSGSLARRSKTHIVSTLAYQLLEHEGLDQVGQVRARICQAIRRSPAILKKHLQTQLDELILLPFQHGASMGARPMSEHRIAIIIDGLDECDRVEEDVPVSDNSRKRRTKEDEQIEILSALLHAATDPSFPFVIVIASRPELAIREFFSTDLAGSATRELFLDDKYDPSADIRLFYEAKFSSIRRRFKLSPEWPTVKELLKLVANASGQFIYAATVMRFIEGPPPGSQNVAPAVPGLRTPHQRLVRIIELRPRAHTPNVRPLEALDILYDSVVRTCSEPLLSMKWLCAISLHGKRWPAPARVLRLWMEQSPGEEVCVLGPLSSLIYIPPDPNCDELYSFHHKSFEDFFSDKSRCVDLYVLPIQTNDFISHMYFRNMDNHFDRIPKSVLHQALGFGGLAMFDFSSADVFKTAEGSMLSCNARRWAEYLAVPEMDVPVSDDRVYSKDLISVMFYAVHVWCPKIRCRRACKHWREAILEVVRGKGWTVPSPMDLFRDGWVRHYTSDELRYFFNMPYSYTDR